MNNNLLNIIGDLHLSIYNYATQPSACFSEDIFLQNIVRNFPEVIKNDLKIKQFVDTKYLQTDADPPKIKAEKLLMMANNLQSYLLK